MTTMECTIDTPPEELARRRMADLEAINDHLEHHMTTVMAERDRAEAALAKCEAECARLRQIVAVAESEGD